jgi:hypothetical protein
MLVARICASWPLSGSFAAFRIIFMDGGMGLAHGYEGVSRGADFRTLHASMSKSDVDKSGGPFVPSCIQPEIKRLGEGVEA